MLVLLGGDAWWLVEGCVRRDVSVRGLGRRWHEGFARERRGVFLVVKERLQTRDMEDARATSSGEALWQLNLVVDLADAARDRVGARPGRLVVRDGRLRP